MVILCALALISKQVHLANAVAMLVIELLDDQQVLNQSIAAIRNAEFNFFDHSNKVVLTEVTINLIYCRLNLTAITHKVPCLYANSPKNTGVMVTDSLTITFNHIIADKLGEVCGKVGIITFCIEFSGKVESVLWCEIRFELFYSINERIPVTAESHNPVLQIRENLRQFLNRLNDIVLSKFPWP